MVAAGILSGCGMGGGGVVSPAASPRLTVNPSPIDFSSVRVGTKASKSITLTNSGGGTLTLSQATVSGSSFTLTGLTLPLNLSGGQSTSFAAIFAPTAAGASSGSLSLMSNATSTVTTVALSGSGATYALTAATTSLNFGKLAVGSSGTKNISFTNTGTEAVTVSQITVAGAGFGATGASLPANLAPGQSSSATVSFSPTVAGAASGTLSIVSDASNSPATVTLTGTAVTYQLGVSPTSLNFGSVTVGSSATQTVTATNTGTANVTISGASATGRGFSASGSGLPLTLAPAQSAALSVTFAPSTAGSAAGSVSIVSSASNTPVTVALTGTGVSSTYQLTPGVNSLSFGSVGVSAKSLLTLSLTNTGTGDVTISQISVTGAGYSLSGLSLPATVAPGQSITLSVTFAPTAAGSATGTLSVSSNASGSPLAIALAGTGVTSTYQLTPSVNSLSFGTVGVQSTSTQTVTLTNTGTASLTISQISVAGAGFSLKGPSLPVTLAPGHTTSLSVTFSPGAAEAASGTMTVVSADLVSPVVLTLSGTGATSQLSATPSSVSFGSVALGDHAILPALLASTGSESVTISQITIAGAGFTLGSVALPLTLAAGQSASVSITFAPAATGAVTGTLTVSSSAAGSPLMLALTGTGIHTVRLTWAASSTPGVTGYNVYRSATSEGGFTVINTSPLTGTSFVDSNVTAGQTYYYKLTAIGAGGEESGFSNAASVTIPTP